MDTRITFTERKYSKCASSELRTPSYYNLKSQMLKEGGKLHSKFPTTKEMLKGCCFNSVERGGGRGVTYGFKIAVQQNRTDVEAVWPGLTH